MNRSLFEPNPRGRGRFTATPRMATKPARHLQASPGPDEDLGMRWAVAWYQGIQSYSKGERHVAA